MSDDEIVTKTVDEILEEINQIDIYTIELDPDAQKFLTTVEAYLYCVDTLEALYEDIDPSHQLANYDMDDIREPIQQVSETGEPVKNLAELYEAAESKFPDFEALIQGLLEQVISSSIGSPEEEESSSSSGSIQFKLPPGENKLKGKERAFEKAQDDYAERVPGPPESWLYDIVRGSVLFQNAPQLFRFLELLRQADTVKIVKSKNRFRNPTISGYRDFNLQIQISSSSSSSFTENNENDDDDGRKKHICELQLHIAAIKEAGILLKSHSHYEFFRKFYGGATESLQERMNDLRVILCKDDDSDSDNSHNNKLDMTFLIQVTQQNPLEVSRMIRLADLFKEYMNEYQLALVVTNAIKNSPDELPQDDWYMRMGELLKCQGKLEDAMVLYQEALEIRLTTLGPDHTNVAQSYHDMAIVLQDQDKFDKAMVLYQKALDIRLKVHGPDHIKVADSYIGMAIVLQNNDGQFDKAMELYQTALDIRSKALGPDHIKVAQTYNNMAVLLHNQGILLDDAMELYQKAVDIFIKTLGSDHTYVAASYNNMAIVLKRQGKLEEALELYRKALDIRLKALGPEHADVAGSYYNMGLVLINQAGTDNEKLEEAMTFAEKAKRISLNALGAEHSKTKDCVRMIEFIEESRS